jgi:hypothetical protein
MIAGVMLKVGGRVLHCGLVRIRTFAVTFVDAQSLGVVLPVHTRAPHEMFII